MSNKSKHHNHHDPDPVFDDTGPSSSQTPYLVPAHSGVQIESILSVGDQVGVKEAPAELAGQPWRMVGIPDGLGAFDNGDGTMTVLMNHELNPTAGVVREHGSTGAFVSMLTVDKTTHEVLDAKDLSEDVFLFNRTTNAYEETTTQFGRLCSADLPATSAFYDAASGLGTTERIFMDGEEIGNEGRAFAHVVTGAEAGNSYELPALGRMSFENSLANAYSGAKTVVMLNDDSTPGEVYVYIGDKQATGNAVEKAGLTNGELFGISASFGDDTGAGALNGTFQLIAQGNNGDVTHTTGTELQAQSDPLTQFGRPEDGAWDPTNPNRYYFITTGTPTQPTRLWAMDYYDIEHPELGGTVKVLVEGVFSNSDPNSALPLMLDNMTVTESGLVIMQEDPGNNPRLAKVWMYDPTADNGVDPQSGLTELAHHDPARFTPGLNTPAPGGTFNQDEESSGVVDVTGLLGNGEKLAFLLDTQAHYANSNPELVEGGQLMAMYVDLPNPGDSKFTGGNGNDVYDGGFGNDRIAGGKGNDVLYGNYGDDKIDGGDGDDSLGGGPGDDDIAGGKGDDHIDGGTGNDVLKGEQGDDVIAGGVGDDRLVGGDGRDTLTGGVGDDDLQGGDDADLLEGNQGSDRLAGGDGNDTLRGGSGNDSLDGGAGADFIDGGAGSDVLRGGAGPDTYFFASPSDGADTILDFRAGQDHIMLDLNVGASQVSFVGFKDGVASVPASGPALIYSDGTGDLFWDPTGGSAADRLLIATLTTSPELHRADFLLV
jgi:Ca2+-binding RTX toxin-like protein